MNIHTGSVPWLVLMWGLTLPVILLLGMFLGVDVGKPLIAFGGMWILFAVLYVAHMPRSNRLDDERRAAAVELKLQYELLPGMVTGPSRDCRSMAFSGVGLLIARCWKEMIVPM